MLKAVVPSVLIAVLFLGLGCGKRPPRTSLINGRMTPAQVDAALGKPLDTIVNPLVPGVEQRRYRGDGNKSIWIMFKNGTVGSN